MATKEELQKKLEELEAKCKQEKQSRLEIQQMFQLVMDSIPQFIFWKDTESVYLGCNQNFAQAAGPRARASTGPASIASRRARRAPPTTAPGLPR